jgi:hypothetical protein
MGAFCGVEGDLLNHYNKNKIEKVSEKDKRFSIELASLNIYVY